MDTAALSVHAGDIAAWRNSLTSNAQIQFWGCDVGAGRDGAAFVSDLYALTGVGVAASTDATGSAVLGGDWTLEATAGMVTPRLPFSADAISGYDSVLDAPTATVSLSGPTSILLGNSFTETLTFRNSATNGVGYGPFVELFVPTDTVISDGANEAVTLTSATYLGSAVSFQAITLTSSDVAHPGVLGAYNPLALDSSGHATFQAAPASMGLKAGDTMYVLTLPFGSFTPGQPTADIVLNFSFDNRSNLSSTGALKIAAIGGYQYGADALNNPSTDPSIVNTAGVQTASSNVRLIDVTSTINYHEAETATGPTFPGNYTLTLTPASVVSSAPINNFDFTFTLPDKVQYTGGTINITGGGTAIVTPSISGPGGTLTVHYNSLNSASTIDIPIFVPYADAVSAEILSPGSGAPVPIALTPVYNYAQHVGTDWSPISGAFTTTPVHLTDSGTGTTLTFEAKSLAVQVTNAEETDVGNTGFTPGDIIKYTINFQVSDYFDLNNLVLTDILGDGMTLVPNMTPTLSVDNNGTHSNITFGAITDNLTTTVNGQGVSGSSDANSNGANWGYAGRDGSGNTTIAFNVGALMAAQPGGTSVLTGSTSSATQGTVTFYAKVLDKYTNQHSGTSLRENDGVTNNVTGSGTVTSHDLGSSAHAMTDTSAVNNAETAGTVALAITAVDGVAPGSPVDIQAGQLVTYTLTYDLQSGDYGNFNLNAFLPLPVFAVPGGGLVNDGVGTAEGTFKVILNPSGVDPATATTNTTANSINFNFGTYDDASNAGGQQVQVQFTLRASSQPFADGLFLTTQGQSQYTNAAGTQLANAVIKQQVMEEPSLVLKTGVVSVVNDANGSKTVTYTADTGSSTADPTTIFEPATNSGVFVGTLPTTIGNAENQNVSGADGADTVRVVETVQNVGHGNAYDVTVNGTLPTGYVAADVAKITITRGDGTVLGTITGSTAIANFFSSTGVTVDAKAGDPTGLALYGTGDATHRDILFITYDLPLASGQSPATVLTATGTIVDWAGAHGTQGFVTGGTAVGTAASDLTDTATITTSSPTFTKTITAGDDSTNVTLNGVVVGETITYTFTLTVPEGDLANVHFTDTIPNFLTDVTLGTPVLSGGLNSTVTVATGLSLSGGVITGNFGDITNTNADTAGTLTFTVTAKVANSTNVDGTTIQNTGTFTYNSTGTLSSSVTATEKDPHIAETLTPSTGSTAVYSGETITYTLTITNNGDAPAEGLADTITIPSGLTYVGSSLTQTGGPTATINDGTRTVSISQLPVGQTMTFTFQATVNNNLAANASLQVTTADTYTSMPGTVTGERPYTANASSTVHTGVFTPVLQIVDQSNQTNLTDGHAAPSQTASLTSADVTVGEIVRMRAYVQFPEGSNNVDLGVTLPSGLEFLNDGTTKIVIASPNADTTTTSSDYDINASGLQVTSTGFNPDQANPTVALASAAIDTSSGLTFHLGTLTNNDGVATPNYVVIEFNALVKNTVAIQDATSLTSTAAVGSTNSNSVALTVKEPHVTISKTVESINQATGVVTWLVTLSNTGDTTAYDVELNDTQPGGANEGAIGSPSEPTNQATNLNIISGNGTTSLQASMDLGAGKTQSFRYTTTVTDRSQPLADATATVTYESLNDANTTAFNGSTYGDSGHATGGTASGERTGADGAGGALNDYQAQVTVGLGTVSGNVWNDLGSPLNAANQAAGTGDTELQSLSSPLSATWSGQTGGAATATTDASGNYSFLVPDNVAVTIAAPLTATSVSTSGATETLVYDTIGAGTFHHTEAGLSSGNAQLAVTASGASQITNVNFAYRLVDAAPVLGTWNTHTAGNELTYTMGGTAVALSTGGTTVADAEINTLVTDGIGNYNGTVLTVARQGGAVSTDVFGASGLLSFTGSGSGNVVYNGTTIGTYTMSSGSLAVTFTNATTSAAVKNVMDNVTYSNTGSSSQLASGIVIQATLTDHNTQTGSSTGNDFQGTGGVKTSNVVTALLDIAPSPVAASFQEPNNTGGSPATSASAVALSPSITIPSGTTTFSQVVLTISGNYQNGQDVLTFTGTGSTGNIAGTWNAAAGTLTLAPTSGTPTVAQWQAALQLVKYYDSSDTPTTAPTRTVSIDATSTNSEVISGTLATVTVAAANDSPVLNTAVTVTLPDGTEDVIGAPVDGTTTGSFLVSSLIGNGTSPNNVADPDGPGTVPSLPGMAILNADTAQGNWYYSTDAGAHWTQFASSSTTAVSATNALHLVADANTRLYFQPKTADWNGTISNALTFRAWDQFDGVANGTLSALPSGLGSGVNTAGSAYSSATDTLPLVVDPVNDAPIASGTATLTTPGTSVSTLFTSHFNDSTDQVTGGSSANTLAGIAITGNASNSSQGFWEYSLDNGGHYTTIGTSLSDSSALILPTTALIRFEGQSGYTGTPGALTTRLIDSSTDVSIPGVGTGLALQGSTSAYTGIDVSGGNHGGITAISNATVPLNTIVAGSVAGAFQEPNNTSPALDKVPVNDTVVLNLNPGGAYTQATFQITGNFHTAEDVLTFTNTSGMGDIVGSYNSTTGAITLTSATATPTQWQTALRAIQYYDSSDTPNTSTRTISMAIVETGIGSQSLGTSTMTVAKANDSPVLDSGVAVSLPDGTEDVIGAPVNGTTTGSFLVSTVAGRSAGPSNVTDPDGPGTVASTTGIAITAADTSEGSWYYSTDAGAHWTQFASSSLPAVSATNSLHLVADANTRLYFQPTIANWNGTIPNALTFRAWDQYDGVANGTLSALPSGLGSSVNTLGSAYSSATDTLPLIVDPVNDAPIASGSASLPDLAPGTTASTTPTVASLFTAHFNDQIDQVTGGSSANSFAGIAITGNAAKVTEGTWKYSTDGGTTWTAVPTTLDDQHAILLPTTALVEFIAVSGYSGTPGTLAVRLIDSSGGPVSFSASSDVSSNGGITAISASTVPLSITVEPVVVPVDPVPPDMLPLTPTQSAFSLGSAIRYLGGREPDWLVGSDVYRALVAGIPGTANVSADVFYGSAPRQTLRYEAGSISGGPLPPWLLFDPSTLRFSGTPPDSLEGTVDLRVVATDLLGRQATAEVHIVILREPRDIAAMLLTSQANRVLRQEVQPEAVPEGESTQPVASPAEPPAASPPVTPVEPTGTPTASPPAPQGPAAPAEAPMPTTSAPTSSPFQGALPDWLTDTVDERVVEGFGLTPQLQEQSTAGRAIRSRMIADALAAGQQIS